MAQHTFKNLTAGPKGITVESGATVYVDGGAISEPLDVSAGELAALKKTEWFEVDPKAEAKSAKPAEPAKPE